MFKKSFFLAFIIISVTLFCPLQLIAQQETWTWYMGRSGGVGLKFQNASSDPIIVNGFSSIVDEACGSIADSAGNLLFYSNGIQIFDANHNQMPQGSGLLADGSSTQGLYIVKQPGNNSKYYVFTTPGGHAEGDLTVGFRYTVVDMELPGNGTLANPLGDVIPAQKNILLFTPSTEKCAVTLHENCKDIWVMGHKFGTNEFYAYLLTETGLTASPIITAINPAHSGPNDKARGSMTFSPNGQKLAYILHDYDTRINIDLFDFDKSTGVVSNRYNIPITISNTDGYGVCFSPNSQVLYASYFLDGKIIQYNLGAADIKASGIVLNPSGDAIGFGKPKLGPNGKIYIPRLSANYISAINNPDVVGIGSNYVQKGVDLGASGTVWLATPEMFVASNEPINIDTIIITDANCSPNGSITIVASGGTPPLKYSINNGVSFSNNNVFDSLSSGTYQIMVEDVNGCYERDSAVINNVSKDILDEISIQSDTCSSCRGTITITAANGKAPYEYSINNGIDFNGSNIFENICTGNYNVLIRDDNGCESNATVFVPDKNSPLKIEIETVPPLCVYGDPITLSANVPGGTWMGAGINPVTGEFFPGISGAGKHQIVYAVLGDCGGSDTVFVEVTEKIEASINPIPQFCVDADPYEMIANPPGGIWSGTGTSVDGLFNPNLSPGIYHVEYILDAGSCGDTAMVSVEVMSPPSLEIFTDDTLGCPPFTVQFSYTGSAMVDNCLWDFGNTQSSTNCDTVTTTFYSPGCYDVVFSAENALGCRGSINKEKMICVVEPPKAGFNANPNPAYTSDPVIQFVNLSSGDSLTEWNFDEYGFSNSKNPRFEFPAQEGIYNVCLNVTSLGGCKDYICKPVEIIDEFMIYVPSAFTPNGDGINDSFFPKLHGILENGFDLKVFNRWGQIVYQSNDIYEEWNGSTLNKNKFCKQDVYNWIILCVDKYQKKTHRFTGHVFLSK